MDTSTAIAAFVGGGLALLLGGGAVYRKATATNSQRVSAPDMGYLDLSIDLSIDAQRLSVSSDGLDLIKQFEALRLEPYQDIAGNWTIGFGHLIAPDENLMRQISRAKAEQLFAVDIAEAEACLRDAVKVPIKQNQFDALASFTFNLGCGNFRSSTMLRLLNGERYYEAGDQLTRWNKSGGQADAGLTRRRETEKSLYMTG